MAANCRGGRGCKQPVVEGDIYCLGHQRFAKAMAMNSGSPMRNYPENAEQKAIKRRLDDIAYQRELKQLESEL